MTVHIFNGSKGQEISMYRCQYQCSIDIYGDIDVYMAPSSNSYFNLIYFSKNLFKKLQQQTKINALLYF